MKKNPKAVPAIFIFLLTVLLFTAVFSQRTHAATTYTEGYFKYQIEDGGVVITGYFGKASEVTVPSQIAGNVVYKIASGAFTDSSTVTQVYLPAAIMTIEEGAFLSNQTVLYYDSSGNLVSAGSDSDEDTSSEDESSGDNTGDSEGDASSEDPDSDSVSDSENENQSNTSADDESNHTSKGETSNSDFAVEEAEATLEDSESGEEDSGDDQDADTAKNNDGSEDSGSAADSDDAASSDDTEESGGSWYQRIFGNTDVSAAVSFVEVLLIILVPVLLVAAAIGFFLSKKKGRGRM